MLYSYYKEPTFKTHCNILADTKAQYIVDFKCVFRTQYIVCFISVTLNLSTSLTYSLLQQSILKSEGNLMAVLVFHLLCISIVGFSTSHAMSATLKPSQMTK